MKIFYLLIPIGILSCTKDPAIGISDLKFPGPQRIFIKQNRVDTTFTIYPQENGGELTSYQTYDENGRILVDSNLVSVVRYHYDKIGLVIKTETRRTDGGMWVDSATYQFDKDSLILREKWNDSDVENKSFFDDSGKMRQSIVQDKVRRRTTNYLYDGDLLRKVQHYSHHKNHLNTLVEIEYYYTTEGILDSATLSTDNGHHQQWVYDSVGLINAEWSSSGKSDTRFVHIRKKGS